MHCNLRPSDVAPVVSRFAYMYQSRPINLQGGEKYEIKSLQGQLWSNIEARFFTF